MGYTDPTGEIAHIAWAAGLGGIFGFGGGFLESAFSQTMDGGDIDWMEALGSGVKGAITGATQAGLLASGAGLPTALFANALAGTAGSAAEQYIGGGRIDPEKSILGGLSNAVSNAIYGTDPLGSGKEAFLRGMGDGAANAALNYLFDTTGNKGVSRAGALPGIAGALFSPYEALRDPRRKCGSASPFIPVPGYGPAKGYQYEMPGAGSGNANTPKKFSICDFLLETVIGGITGGLSSAAFYGAGKGIERLMDGLRPGRGGETLGNNNADFVVAPGGVTYTAKEYENMVVPENLRTLYHYTTEEGMQGILRSQKMNPSIKTPTTKDARMGSGQYFTDIIPNSKTDGQISRILFGVQWNTKKVTNYIEVDTSNLNVLKGRDNIFYIPGDTKLDLTNRIINFGKTGR